MNTLKYLQSNEFLLDVDLWRLFANLEDLNKVSKKKQIKILLRSEINQHNKRRQETIHKASSHRFDDHIWNLVQIIGLSFYLVYQWGSHFTSANYSYVPPTKDKQAFEHR